MTSVKGNIILNVINTVVGLLFPLVTFPYVSRVLMPEGIGIVQFYQSIINYIVLLSAIGIPLYAVREISRLRDDREKMKIATLEILTLHAIMSTIGYFIVFILAASVSKINSQWPLFLLLSLPVFFNVIGVAWFYQAMEEFRYITIRSLVVKFISGAALFTFVKTKDDIYIYAAILVCAEVGNYLFNFVRLRHYVSIYDFKISNLDIKRHLAPAFKIFLVNFTISMYVNLNPVMLGFLSNETCVAYYAATRKIIAASNGLTIALGTALLPRLSSYFAAGKEEEYEILKKKALDVVSLLCVPITICAIIIAPVLIPVFSGDAYTPAIPTLQLNAPAILISAFNYIIAIQILYSQNQEKLVILATSAGAIVNIIVNLLLIPHLQQNGTAIAACAGEITTFGVCLVGGRNYIGYIFFNRNNTQALASAIICGAGVWATGHFLGASKLLILLTQLTTGIAIYAACLAIMRNALFIAYSKAFAGKVLKLLNIKS